MNYKEREKLRHEDLWYAYHFVKSDGIEALAERLTKREQMQEPVIVSDEYLQQFKREAMEKILNLTLACTLGVLESKYGFTDKEKMDEYTTHFVEIWDAVYGGWLDWTDLTEFFKDEYGFDINVLNERANQMLEKVEKKIESRTEFVGEVRKYQRRKPK